MDKGFCSPFDLGNNPCRVRLPRAIPATRPPVPRDRDKVPVTRADLFRRPATWDPKRSPERAPEALTQTALVCNHCHPHHSIRETTCRAQASARRRLARTPVNAFVYCGRHFRRAQIVDYSLGGLMLEGTLGLIKHDPAQVELITGTGVLG